jgi:hypothetical protein
MLTEDYLIRMINIAIAALLRIVGLRSSGSYEEARLLIDMTFEQLLGLPASMAKNLDDGRIYYLLSDTDGALDTRRLAIIAELFHEQGEIMSALNREGESRADFTRALRYYLEVFFSEQNQRPPEHNPADLRKQIEELAGRLDLPSLGPDTLWPLTGYFEEAGAFARAEAILLELAERPGLRAEIAPELAAFYERMAAKTPAQVSAGGIDPAALAEKRARWK